MSGSHGVYGGGFALIVVLFILLIIIGASWC
ncbi:YjcZ family sporulation protein [Neobacillus sp. DY30]|nr:YjcZ family sporulation protein [Neobacillus sp. DY30]WHY02019.1 YjcZ family sporulation protein [Neobacillus sp. DY30]